MGEFNTIPIRITSLLSAITDQDEYPLLKDIWLQGGLRIVDNLNQLNRSFIPWKKRRRMMMVVVASGNAGLPELYWFRCPVNPTEQQLDSDQYWEKVPLGLTLNGVTTFKGFFDPSSFTIADSDSSNANGDVYIVDASGNVNTSTMFGGESTNLSISDYVIFHESRFYRVPSGNVSFSWQTLPGKPERFPAESHTHNWTDIEGRPDISLYLKLEKIVSVVPASGNNNMIPNVEAVRNYIDSVFQSFDPLENLDLSGFYTKTQVDQLLLGVQGSNFTVFSTIAAMVSSTGNSVGDQAYNQEDDGIWRFELSGESNAWVRKYSARLTAAEVKSKLLSNSDTNILTDTEKSAVGNLPPNTNQELANLLGGVPAEGNSLNKLYDLILSKYSINRRYNDIAARDSASGELADQENVYVADASADLTVTSGWAIYKWLLATTEFIKIQEQESIDVVLTALATAFDDSSVDFTAANVQVAIDAIFTRYQTSFTSATYIASKLRLTRHDGTFSEFTIESGGGGGVPSVDPVFTGTAEFENISVSAIVNFQGDNITFGSLPNVATAYKLVVQETIGGRVKTLDLVPVSQSNIDSAITSLKGGVPSAGDTLDKLYNLIQSIQAIDVSYADITARDADVANLTAGQNVYVTDASADPTVTSGWAIYKFISGSTFVKLAEQEGLDIIMTAAGVTYDNSTSGLTATDVKAALDELAASIATKLGDAPSDGSQYVRKDGAWVAVTISPVLKVTETLSASGPLTFNLDTFDYHQGITFNANATQVNITNGVVAKPGIKIKCIQGATGGTLSFAPFWTAGESILLGDLRIFSDLNEWNVYRANANHTAHASDYTADLSIYWVLAYRIIPSTNKPVLGNAEGDVDFIEIFKEAADLYSIFMHYGK